MAAKFTANRCIVVMHLFSYMGVAGLAHHWSARVAADQFGQSFAAFYVEDNIRSRLAGEYITGKNHHQLVWPNDPAAGRNNHYTITVTIKGQSQICIFRLYPLAQIDKIFFVRRVGFMVWK